MWAVLKCLKLFRQTHLTHGFLPRSCERKRFDVCLLSCTAKALPDNKLINRTFIQTQEIPQCNGNTLRSRILKIFSEYWNNFASHYPPVILHIPQSNRKIILTRLFRTTVTSLTANNTNLWTEWHAPRVTLVWNHHVTFLLLLIPCNFLRMMCHLGVQAAWRTSRIPVLPTGCIWQIGCVTPLLFEWFHTFPDVCFQMVCHVPSWCENSLRSRRRTQVARSKCVVTPFL